MATPMQNIVVQGVPFDAHSSFRRGPADAPGRIREALYSYASNMTAESGRDLAQDNRWRWGDEMQIDNTAAGYPQIEAGAAATLASHTRLLTIGGDHSISYPILRAHRPHFPRLTVVQFDAHPDLYESLDGNRFSHACPFARIMEDKLADRLIQIGIRTLNAHQKEQAARFGVEIIDMNNLNRIGDLDIEGPLYISLDLDVLDPAFAPGVSHHEPGGLSTRQLLKMIQTMPGRLLGGDIVEYNPDRDWLDMTAMTAAKCLKELLDRMLGELS